MNVVLYEATAADLPVVKNLVRYYIYDMSEYMGWPCRPNGIYDGCDNIESYWTEQRRHAFMFRDGRELSGFAMVRGDHEKDEIDYSIAEFFVLRKFRREGVGERTSRQLFDRFPGRWMVAQLAANDPALAFWRRVISRHTQDSYTESKSESPWGQMNEIRFASGGS